MARFSDELRRERERRHISMEMICAETKVSVRHLEALEAGQYTVLPGGVFRKGILRSYLAAVGLEETPWVQRFEDSLRESGAVVEETDWTEFAENVRRNRSGSVSKANMRWMGVGTMVTVLGVLGWAVWKFALHGRLTP
jgi:cytoskeleton protein RodZ